MAPDTTEQRLQGGVEPGAELGAELGVEREMVGISVVECPW